MNLHLKCHSPPVHSSINGKSERVSLMVKHEEGERRGRVGTSRRGGEVNGLIPRSVRRGLRATHATGPVCPVLQGQVHQVKSKTVDRKISCFDLTPSLSLSFSPLSVALCCSHSLLFTYLILFPPSHRSIGSHCAG